MELLSLEERWSPEVAGTCPQHFWYRLAAGWARGRSILDVGAGNGYGLDMLASVRPAKLLGVDPQPLRGDIADLSLEHIPDRVWDGVLAIDVIEHIEDDGRFLAHLLRVAREFVFLSTSNWNRWHCENEFHCREYTPQELDVLLAGLRCSYWTADDVGGVRPIGHLVEADSQFGVRIEVS